VGGVGGASGGPGGGACAGAGGRRWRIDEGRLRTGPVLSFWWPGA